jgi:hypothetical protein
VDSFPVSICTRCNSEAMQPYDDAWRRLSTYLQANWKDLVGRGQFDLTKIFGPETAIQAVNVQLFFVMQLGCKLNAARIAVDLTSLSAALTSRIAHPDITLLVANCSAASGRFVSYDSEVSLLRDGETVLSALWTYLAYPVAIKVCYVKAGAPVREPEGFPWHPTRQRKIVKLSPYRGDTQPLVARRDLRI